MMVALSTEVATVPQAERRNAWLVLFVLFVTYLFNVVDRQLLSILAEPIRRELGLLDWQLGLLSGLAFAMLYTSMGLPIARLADRHDRRVIIAAAVLVWSVMTAACGLAVGFMSLLLARVLVGLGEAGGVAPAFSLIVDYFPLERRATAIALFNLGSPLGVLVGLSTGGWIADAYGWRAAFLIAGGLGLMVAGAVWWIIRDPRSAATSTAVNHPSFTSVLRFLWGQPSYRHLAIGTAVMAIATYGFLQWIPAFLIRSYGVSVSFAGLALGLIVGIGGALGSFVGGFVSDRLGRRDLRWYVWLPAVALVIAMPLSAGIYRANDLNLSLLFIAPAYFLLMTYAGPCFSLGQTLVPVHMRASSSAVLLLVINLIGLGIGPHAIGIVSDILQPAYGTESLRHALLLSTPFILWAAVHYVIAGRTLREDVDRAARVPHGRNTHELRVS
jgi:predicted MFS family arabinose efflux permease